MLHIAIAAPPKTMPTRAGLELPPLFPLPLVDLRRELTDIAKRDPRFEGAAALATDLERELTLLTGETPPRRTRRRRSAASRGTHSPQAAERLNAFETEMKALGDTCERIDELGIVISSQQLADLRLGERTRRIFADAGLLHVQDVVTMPAARATQIPQLAPASVAELRAAIMFAAEAIGNRRGSMFYAEARGEDLFEGLADSVNSLPPREREVVFLRTGVGDRVHDVGEVARALGCIEEQIPQLERHARNTLLSQPLTVESCWRLEELCSELGLGWDDERLPKVVAIRYPNTRASFTRLVGWLLHEKGQLAADAGGRKFTPPHGIAHFDEMVVAALGRYGDLSEDLLTSHIRAAFSAGERETYPKMNVSKRVKMLGPALQAEDGSFRLPDAPILGLEDRHIRALNGLIGALQRMGVSRITSLTTEVNRRLPRAFQVNEQFVRTWLTRHPELFTRADKDSFKLASLDVDILCGLATSWMPGAAPAVADKRTGSLSVERLRERLAAEIADFLAKEGPQPIDRIRTHFYGRFSGIASADVAIAQSPARFTREPTGMIGLRESDDLIDDQFMDFAARPPRGRWQRRTSTRPISFVDG